MLWRYSLKDYEGAVSGIKLDSRRLKKLEGFEGTELEDVANAINEKGLAGYQENMIESLVWDVDALYYE